MSNNKLNSKILNNDSSKTPSQENNISKHKDLLQKLLKEKLQSKLSILETSTSSHMSILSSSSTLIKSLTALTIKMNKQVEEKINKEKEKEKEKQAMNHKNTKSQRKSVKPQNKSTINVSKNTTQYSKTPVRNTPKLYKIQNDNKSEFSKTMKSLRPPLAKNKTTTNIHKNINILETSSNKERKKSYNTNKNNNETHNTYNNTINTYSNKDENNTMLKKPSVISSKSNKSNKSNNTITKHPIKKGNIKIKEAKTPTRKKTPFKSKISTEERNKDNIKANKTIEVGEFDSKPLIDMNKMESNLQNANLSLKEDDPLLVAPITDLDFIPNGVISNNCSIKIDTNENDNSICLNSKLNEKIFDNENFMDIICDYLEIYDLINFKNINKKYKKIIMNYFMKKLENDKIYFTIKQKDLGFDMNNLPPKLDIKNLTLSKGAQKAIDLLNEVLLNKIFSEEKVFNEDILIIYRIFFQMIGHPYKYIPKDNNELFWDKCRHYFINETNGGKTGDLLQKIINENKINISGDNLYQLYKLTKKDLNKIAPQYYSKMCGTTGLFVFIIKDVLDFVGISNTVKTQDKGYWTYVSILESINNKINFIKETQK